jgi:hypothetical protein
MNFKKIIICLVSGLAFCASVRADDLAMNNAPATAATAMDSANPYELIVTRNVFGLNPPVVDTNPPVDASLPKITPNGILGEYGQFQVLFKVTPTGKPGAKDQYYTMSEGEAQDDIEVMHIDSENQIVTFKNHGTVQEIPLAEAPSSGGNGAAPSPLPGNRNFNPAGNNGENPGPGNRFIRFGNRGGGPGGFNRHAPGADNVDGAGGSPFNSANPNNRTYQPAAPNMTPEESAIIIEEQRAQALDNHDPKAALFPPTPLTGKY